MSVIADHREEGFGRGKRTVKKRCFDDEDSDSEDVGVTRFISRFNLIEDNTHDKRQSV